MKILSAVCELFQVYRKVDVRTDERRCSRRYAWVRTRLRRSGKTIM